MVRQYKKFHSDEIHLAEREPDVTLNPNDKPAGDFSRIQRRRWKIWIDTATQKIFIRKTKNINDWTPLTVTTTKAVIVQNIVAGSNTVTHNLNLPNPQGFVVNAITIAGQTVTISNYTGFTVNSFTFNSGVNLGSVTITVV